MHNLAQAKAAMGTRVLVVETDMRSNGRKNHDTFNQDFELGLSDLLTSENLAIKQAIHKSNLEDNLFILSSGSFDRNIDTSKLLSSPKMRNLMEKLQQHFDLVIYDVAPVIDYADVSLLAAKTEGIILVAGLGKLQVLKLKEAINQLNISRIPMLGVVINKLTPSV